MEQDISKRDAINDAIDIVSGSIIEGYYILLQNEYKTITVFKNRTTSLYTFNKFIKGNEGGNISRSGTDPYLYSFDFVLECNDPKDAIKAVMKAIKDQTPRVNVHTLRRRQIQ